MMYAYCRVSTKSQDIQRQIDNIKAVYPDIPDTAYYTEKFTGKTIDRPQWNKLFKRVNTGDTIVFDSVSRMSRNAAEGADIYEKLYNRGVNLVFLNEPMCNTDTYRQAKEQSIKSTGNEIADIFIDATNRVLIILAKKQIEQAFEQAEKERTDIVKRVKDGMRSRKEQNPDIKYGISKGTKLTTKKSLAAKEIIKKHSKTFNGTLKDIEVMKIAGITRNSYYKYKAEIKAEIEQE